ncbi:MAG: radical SAM protein, partial [Endomicrobiia bacterium]
MLKDRFGRIINYLRVAITNKCNFNCIYCKNSDLKIQDHPLENFLRVIKIANSLGIKNFRITGGEPFIKSSIMDFFYDLAKLNINIAITTNASLIKDSFIEKLMALKIKKINISLDSINPETFKNITKKNDLKKVLSTIEKLKKIKSEIKINTVLLNKINSEEIY